MIQGERNSTPIYLLFNGTNRAVSVCNLWASQRSGVEFQAGRSWYTDRFLERVGYGINYGRARIRMGVADVGIVTVEGEGTKPRPRSEVISAESSAIKECV